MSEKHPPENVLRDFVEGKSLGDEHYIIEGHIRDCNECAGAVEDMRHAHKEQEESHRIHGLARMYH
ncbi:hypothetical protein COU17_03520 [Candidatus Kaiserbacteria bacterium CG10_big_fil_rev_8_21_14_0_10_49_17]|uniref:Zinc-finger domain-containing protein n=1 Tax=Candidatus Kaiserbacteria bacterium CG10_big_fil_rev_8_21_14_0_10_49_17 TaxID=1974609 RepID=A0A2M6WDL5_9BACT|nr:MAG: hypothetical protein COU17_03520 [Candidatus Kaiserbacteria bacterium CG10_big_fil_rev_8_21_14_0_10_49_17]